MIEPSLCDRTWHLFEGQTETKSHWMHLLENTSADIEKLVSANILQRTNMSDLLRLNLVGLLNINKTSFFCFPKIFRGKNFDKLTVMKGVVKIIERYRSINSRKNIGSLAGEAELHTVGQKRIDHFLALLFWIRDNNFHMIRSEHATDYGKIDWRRTMGTALAVHQGGDVVYVDTVQTTNRDQLSEIAYIQAYAVLDIFSKIGSELLSIWIEPNDPSIQRCEEILAESDFQLKPWQIRQSINEFSASATRDHEKTLAELLFRWNQQDFLSAQFSTAYGFSAFHTVWEHMCGFLFDNGSTNIVHAEIASQPSYYLSKKVIKTSPQRPDILVQSDDEIFVGDAKWYDFDSGKLPKLPDITKQLMYQISIQERHNANANFFLLPTARKIKLEPTGSVKMSFGDTIDHRFNEICLLVIGWDHLVDTYLDNCDAENDVISSSEILKILRSLSVNLGDEK